MEYLSSKNLFRLIFHDIKPRDVLILVDFRNRKKSIAKWSIPSLLLNSAIEEEDKAVNLSEKDAIWKAPEIITNNNQLTQPDTIESNVFTVGLVFAYILLGGKHLYDSGDDQIINNIKNNKPVNLYSKLYN